MKVIKQEDLIGSKVTSIFCENIEGEHCNYTATYFLTDRDLSFMLPFPGEKWESVEVPETADELQNTWIEESYRVKHRWLLPPKFIPEPPITIDIVKRIKEKTILGIFCFKEDEHDLYEPESLFIQFEDGTRLFCPIAAPQGIPTGFFVQEIEEYNEDIPIINFFDIETE